MNRFLKGLSSKNRQVFVARFYYNSPIDEISRTLDIPVNTVKSIIRRMKRALQEFLDKEGIDV